MATSNLTFRCGIFLLLLSFVTLAFPGQDVRVGAYIFAPYAEKESVDPASGIKVELLDLMNAFQTEYRFVPVETGPVRRFRDFDAGLYDVMCFENLSWGWQDRPVDASNVYLGGGEVYVALAKPGRDETYFADLDGKRMIGMRGYHYGFAKFNADPRFLENEFRMALTNENEMTLRFLLLDRGDVAVVTQAFLPGYLERNPKDRDKLLISKKMDQTYAHSCLVRRGSQPDAKAIDQLLEQMRRKGVLKPLWRKYGAAQK